MVKVLVFDTESTSLGPIMSDNLLSIKKKRNIEKNIVSTNISVSNALWNDWISKWPYITQLGYVVYDTNAPTNSILFNKYINNIPDDIIFSTESSNITHIYKNVQDVINKGINPKDPSIIILSTIYQQTPAKTATSKEALDAFLHDFSECEYVVGHSVDFDKKMILAELHRLGMNPEFKTILVSKKFICTKMLTKHICKIKNTNPKLKLIYKYPRLIEAYHYYFGYKPVPTLLHNALVDAVVCLRVFCKLNYGIDVYGTNEEITTIINSFTPHSTHRNTAKWKGTRNARRRRTTTAKRGRRTTAAHR